MFRLPIKPILTPAGYTGTVAYRKVAWLFYFIKEVIKIISIL